MTTAITARQNGDHFQAYVFWKEACHLLARKGISRVGFEVSQFRAFDDVAIEYSSPRSDGAGGLLDAEFFQIKFAATWQKEVTYQALMDPAFINASEFSLLQRLRDAALCAKTAHLRHRFILASPWRISAKDALKSIHETGTGALRLDKLFEGKTKRSATGQIRAEWAAHLGLTDEDELRDILSPFCIRFRPETLDDIRRDLALGLTAAGLSFIEDGVRTDPYSQLIWRLNGEGRNWFDAQALEDICRQEGLWVDCPDPAPSVTRLGIRTFMRWAENLEDETDATLCLTQNFSNRQVCDQSLWEREILPQLKRFLSQQITPGCSYALHVPAHGSLAFAAGYLIEPKMNARTGVVQGGWTGRSAIWFPDAGNSGQESAWEQSDVDGARAAPDLALAVSVTHCVLPDVQAYVSACLPDVGRIAHLSLKPPSQQAIADGAHAASLARELAQLIIQQRSALSANVRLHLFWAAPNGFVFLFGQLMRPAGACCLYEFYFESTGLGRYAPSLTLTPQDRLG